MNESAENTHPPQAPVFLILVRLIGLAQIVQGISKFSPSDAVMSPDWMPVFVPFGIFLGNFVQWGMYLVLGICIWIAAPYLTRWFYRIDQEDELANMHSWDTWAFAVYGLYAWINHVPNLLYYFLDSSEPRMWNEFSGTRIVLMSLFTLFFVGNFHSFLERYWSQSKNAEEK